MKKHIFLLIVATISMLFSCEEDPMVDRVNINVTATVSGITATRAVITISSLPEEYAYCHKFVEIGTSTTDTSEWDLYFDQEKVSVTYMQPATTYHYRILIIDSYDNRIYGSWAKFSTTSGCSPIYYTSSDGKIITPYSTNGLNTKIVSNDYSNGRGTITFEAPLTDIVTDMFYGREKLISITIPSSVTSIGNYAFKDCSSLTSITIPSNVTSIGSYAFSGCFSLTSITMPNSVTSIGDYAFECCSGLTKIAIPNSVTKINDHVFFYCTSLTSITIPSGITSISSYAFLFCTSLASITIPGSVISIGGSAFGNCTSLTSIIIPNSVTSIGDYALSQCTSLTSIYISNRVTSIEDCTFIGCKSLVSITIPSSVTSIGSSAFYDCTALSSVYCKPTSPPTGGTSMFYNNASGRKIYVPTASVSSYKSANKWSNYSSYIVGYAF